MAFYSQMSTLLYRKRAGRFIKFKLLFQLYEVHSPSLFCMYNILGLIILNKFCFFVKINALFLKNRENMSLKILPLASQ